MQSEIKSEFQIKEFVLLVKNYPKNWKEHDLFNLFKLYGEIENIYDGTS